jgi:hypothetical protein
VPGRSIALVLALAAPCACCILIISRDT